MAEAGGISPVHGISLNAAKLRAQQMHAQKKLQNLLIRQQATKAEFTQWTELSAFNPLTISKRFETLDKRMKREEGAFVPTEIEAEEEIVETLDSSQELSREYARRNPELKSRTLLIIRSHIKPDDDLDTILYKITRGYADPSLADDVLDFLIEAEEIKESELAKKLVQAKIQFNERYLSEIRAGKNIAAEAREFSQKGLGTPTGLRDLYRNITGNPREPTALFEELNTHFDYEKMKKVVAFLLHALGSDLKSKGPSISPAELQRLLEDTRAMQAILGIYRFFLSRMKLIKSAFEREDLTLPPRLSFEFIAKQFIKFIQERYPSPDKVIKLALLLGLSEEIAAQIIIFMQYRDALRNVSPRLFKSDKHRQDLLMAVIEALSDLEDELEEKEEVEEKE